MVKKLLDITEGAVAMLALLGLISISTFSVLALNPKESQEEYYGPDIAGLITNSDETLASINIVNTLQEKKGVRSSIRLLDRGLYEYKLSFSDGSDQLNREEIFKIDNISAQDKLVAISYSLQEDLKNSAYINVSSGVAASDFSNGDFLIKTSAKSSNSVELNFSLTQKVNFDFELIFLIEVK